jgi:hypothetical protein
VYATVFILFLLVLGVLLNTVVLKAVYVSMFLNSFVTVCIYFVDT